MHDMDSFGRRVVTVTDVIKKRPLDIEVIQEKRIKSKKKKSIKSKSKNKSKKPPTK
jgi:hypothetical protein